MLQHVEAELDDQPALLGRGDELARRDAAVQRMLPAGERLEAGDGIVFQPHDRLVDDVDIARLQRLAELAVEIDAAAAHAEGRLVELHVVAAVALRLIDRGLGPADLLFGRAFGGRRRDADRGGHEDVAVADGDRRLDGADQLARHLLDRRRLGLREHDHREGIAVQARQHVLRRQQPHDAARQREQHGIADRMAELGVHVLEIVDVEDDDGRRRDLLQPAAGRARSPAGRGRAAGSAGRSGCRAPRRAAAAPRRASGR